MTTPTNEQTNKINTDIEKINALLPQVESKYNTKGLTRLGTLTSDSGSARADATSTNNDVKDAETNFDNTGLNDYLDRLKELQDNEKEILDQQEQRSQQTLVDQLASIDSTFDVAKKQTEKQQEKEFAGRSTKLITSGGGFLGTTQSQQGVLQSLSEDHRFELQSLAAKRIAAINDAKNAAANRDYELAKERLTSARQIEQDIFKVQESFADRQMESIKLEDSRQSRLVDDARQSFNLLLNTLGGVGIEQLDPRSKLQLMDIANTAGVPPEFLASGFRTTSERNQATSEEIQRANLSISYAHLNLANAKYEDSLVIDSLEAQRLGLPRSLVGVTKTQIESDMKSPTPPAWYTEYYQSTQASTPYMTPAPLKLNENWNDFRNEILTSDSDSGFDFGALGGISIPGTTDITK